MKYINTTTSTIIMVYTDGNSGGAYIFRVIDKAIFEMWDVAVGGWVWPHPTKIYQLLEGIHQHNFIHNYYRIYRWK